MMYPRLKLLQRLLAEDGFIFVSIDVFEYANLKCIMDEIFGVANFRNCISVRRGIKNVQAQFETVQALSLGHEYIYLYSKNPQAKLPKLSKDFEIENMKSLDTAQKKVNGDGKKQEPAKQLKIMKNFFLNMQIRCPLMITILSI